MRSGGISMTESPINPDEAKRIKETLRPKPIGTMSELKTMQCAMARAAAMFPEMVDELVASRERIAELERKIESTRKAQLQEVIDNDHAIIPQAEDAIILKRLLKISEEEMKDERVVIFLDDLKKEREMYARYLAAIEGGKP